MIKREEISVDDVVRLRSGSPKFLVSDITPADASGNYRVEIFAWSDRQGFVSRYVPLSWLCWPKPAEEAPATA